MKIVVVILSLILFSQSLSVCGPSLTSPTKESCSTETISDDGNASHEKIHSCCSAKKAKDSKKDKPKKGCCSDGCKCFCHSPVIVINWAKLEKREIVESPAQERNNMPILVHSFDFHPSVSYPPQF
jgi:hypothetical protein